MKTTDEKTTNELFSTAQTQFQNGQYEEAKKNFSIVAKGSEQSNDWFNLSSSATMSGDIDLGKKALHKAIKLAKKEGLPPATQIMYSYYFLCALIDTNKYDEALKHANVLKKSYHGVTDETHFLAATGGKLDIPTFYTFIRRMETLLKKINKNKAVDWLENFAEKVDEDGKEVINKIKSEL